MAARFDIKTLMMLGLLWGACGEEGEPQGPRELEDEDETDEGGDESGSKKDGGRDAGEDTASSDDDDDEGSSDDDDAAGDDDDAAGTDDADSACDELTYDSFGEEFAKKYCTKCHEGDEPIGGIPLDSLDTLGSFKADVITRVVDKKTMPPKNEKAQPTADERAKLKEWLDCGPE